jgi:carbon monoxide dehydrogenase subunit G
MSANAPSTTPPASESATREPLLVFVHIRKTAGKTLRQILYRNYTRGRTRLVRNYFVAPDISLNVVKDLASTPPPDLRAIHGHFLFWPDIAWPENTQFLTLLRDPVERVISHYFWLRSRSNRFRKTLEEAVGEGAIHDNLQTRVLAAQMPPFGETTEDMLEAALAGLNRMTVVGLTERFDESLVLATRALGWRRMLYRRENVTPDRKPREEISPEIIALINRRNELDIELYRTASERFEREIDSLGDEFKIEVAALERANERVAGLPEDAPLDPLPSTIASPNGSPEGGLDLRELLIEAQAQLLERDAAIEHLSALSTPRTAARVAMREHKADKPLGGRRAALEDAIEKARARVESAREELRELENEGSEQSQPARLEALRQTEAMATKRLEGFERRSRKLDVRLGVVDGPDEEPSGEGETETTPGPRKKKAAGRGKKQRPVPQDAAPAAVPARQAKPPKSASKPAKAATDKDERAARERTAKVAGTRRIDGAPPQLIWDALDRPDRIAKLIPAIESFDIKDESTWTANVKIPLKPGAPLQLKCQKSDERPPEHGRLTVSGKGAGATVKIEASFDLSEVGEGTDVKWDLDVTLTGSVGPMGPRVLQVLVRRQMKNLFAALEHEVARSREDASS